MAKASASIAVDLYSPEGLIAFFEIDENSLIKADSKQIALKDPDGNKQVYSGRFNFADGWIDYESSYLTGFVQYNGSKPAFSVSGFKLDGTVYDGYWQEEDAYGMVFDVFAGSDDITGSKFDDVLFGWGGSNKLNGGIGVDTLISYVRPDTTDLLTGGKQGDLFQIFISDLSGEKTFDDGKIVITDFKYSEGDRIQIGSEAEEVLSFSFDEEFSGESGSVVFVPGKKEGMITIDTDGDLEPNVFISLRGFKGGLASDALILDQFAESDLSDLIPIPV